FPDAAIDFNHGFALAQGGPGEGRAAGIYRARVPEALRELKVGIIDSALNVRHPAFAGAVVRQRNFAPAQRRSGEDHGTAVASILIGRTPSFSGLAVGAQLYAASVLVSDKSMDLMASSDGLVRALAWLADERVDVVNMSLAGPPNAVLERALQRLRGQGTVIVAAVGNDGPFAKPRYPAAYEEVIGVGAVDASGLAYARSGRGPHVEFAAPGVDVPAAARDGGTTLVTGTSFASPVVAGLILQRLATAPNSRAALDEFRDDTLDLGAPGPDPVYGRGLAGRSLLIAPLAR
ncbi:MAG: S8 family serine peptidase, partial [Pseudomonadota bacterium]